jgi:predicted CoA-binding protein
MPTITTDAEIRSLLAHGRIITVVAERCIMVEHRRLMP